MDATLVFFLAAYAVLLSITALGQREIRAFLDATPAITDSQALERFKQVARHNMYGALVQIPLGIGGLLAGLVLVSRHGLTGLALVLAVNGLLYALAKQTKALEVRARTLPASSTELQRQHQHIGEVWVKRPLPDF